MEKTVNKNKVNIGTSEDTFDLFYKLCSDLERDKGFNIKQSFAHIVKAYDDSVKAAKEHKENTLKELKEIGKKSTKQGSGLERVRLFVEAIMTHNQTADRDKTIYLTPNFIEVQGKLYRPNVTKFFEENAEMIAAHNKEYFPAGDNNYKFRNRQLYPVSGNRLELVTEILKRQGLEGTL